jgi:hypothetical protein
MLSCESKLIPSWEKGCVGKPVEADEGGTGESPREGRILVSNESFSPSTMRHESSGRGWRCRVGDEVVMAMCDPSKTSSYRLRCVTKMLRAVEASLCVASSRGWQTANATGLESASIEFRVRGCLGASGVYIFAGVYSCFAGRRSRGSLWRFRTRVAGTYSRCLSARRICVSHRLFSVFAGGDGLRRIARQPEESKRGRVLSFGRVNELLMLMLMM